MTQPPDHPPRHAHWDAERLWQQLEPLLPGLSIEVVARTDSTNTQLLERARMSSGRRDSASPLGLDGSADELSGPFGRRTGDTQPCLLVAEHQTRGRGRMGRVWQSAPSSSLTFSLALALQARDWSGLSLAVGVALADALDPIGAPGASPRIGLKWPNDLWLLDGPGVGRKLGGILIETVVVGRHRMAVIGVGLNVLPQPVRDVSHGYACLQELNPAADAAAVLHQVARPLVEGLLSYQSHGFAGVAGAYARRDLLVGRQVSIPAVQGQVGVAIGIADDGSLRVRTDGGSVHLVASGEVGVIPIQSPPAPAVAPPHDSSQGH